METAILEVVEARRKSVCPAIKVWKFPEPGKTYILAADPCFGGSGGDNAAIEVIDAETGEQCAEFASIVTPEDLAPIILDLAIQYNNAEVAVEVNSVGMITKNILLRRFNYENIYRFKRLDRLKNVMTDIVGWWTDYKSKERMESTFREFCKSNLGLIHSKKLLDEIVTYGNQGAETDDRFMALMIALSVRNERVLVAA